MELEHGEINSFVDEIAHARDELVLVADEGKQYADRRTSPSRSKSATGCWSAASSSCCSGSVRAVCDQLNEQVQPAGAAAFRGSTRFSATMNFFQLFKLEVTHGRLQCFSGAAHVGLETATG